ncbi:hypothetical protein H5410_013351 [Solanum commersonii]|uniref:Uncharacterized protein n=1 Tax=Solanum commersonii TaxID=4109 RepID=A0A9J6AU93_SOLCO|nr:hypothetical protein H5410_013351 [Solanum commersonii]
MHYGMDWYECQQETKYQGDEYVDEGRLRQEFPNDLAQINALGLQNIFMDQALNEYLGTPNYDNADFLAMIERTPYRDIRHTLCGVNSVARWDRHTTDVTRERSVLVYRLMKGLPVNAKDILKQNMLKFRTNKRWRFCYGSIITRTKVHDQSQGPVLTTIDRQAHDDSWMGAYVWNEPIDDGDATADEDDGSAKDESDDTGPEMMKLMWVMEMRLLRREVGNARHSSAAKARSPCLSRPRRFCRTGSRATTEQLGAMPH